MSKVLSYTFFMLFICLINPAMADTLWLKDGTQLIGEIRTITNNQLTLETKHIGSVVVDLNAIDGITSSKPLRIQSSATNPAEGLLEYRDNKQYVLDGSVSTLVSSETIATLQDPAAPPAQSVTPVPVDESNVEWSGRIEFGLNGATGNSENFTFLGKTEATRESESRLLYLYFHADYQKRNGDRTVNEFLGGTRYEWVLTDRLNAFVKLELELDEFENLDLRTTLTGGLAYTLIESDRQDLIARGGIGYQRESFDDGTTEDQAIFDLGYDYRLDIWERFRLIHKLAYLAVADNPINDFRVIVDTAGEIPLTKDEAWKIRLGMYNAYDNAPQPGVENLDTKYFLNLVYDW